MSDRSPLALALAFAAGSLITIFAWSIAAPGRSTDAAESGQGEIVLELQRLRESLQQWKRTSAPVQGVAAPQNLPGPRSERTPDLLPILTSLDQSIQGLAEQLASDGSGGGAAVGIPRARALKHEADWAQLQPIAELFSVDEDRAKRQVRFLTPSELLARFGPPDEVWAANDSSSVSWFYGKRGVWEGEADSQVAEVTFRIQDGYVIDAWGEDWATEALLEDQNDE